jgi:hypothetical protein
MIEWSISCKKKLNIIICHKDTHSWIYSNWSQGMERCMCPFLERTLSTPPSLGRGGKGDQTLWSSEIFTLRAYNRPVLFIRISGANIRLKTLFDEPISVLHFSTSTRCPQFYHHFSTYYGVSLLSLYPFLCSFRKLRRVTVTSVMSGSLFVRTEHLVSNAVDLHEVWYLSIFRKSVKSNYSNYCKTQICHSAE